MTEKQDDPNRAGRQQEKDDNFRTFFDNVGDIIIVGSPDGKIFYTNPAASLKLGYSPAELKTMHVLDVHPPGKRSEAEDIFAAMFKGERETCPLPLQRKDGALVPVETRVWFGKWSGADCIFGLSRDLSREQEALQKFDRLFRSNPAPMAVSMIPGRELIDVNDAWLNTLGYTREEVIGRTSAELGLIVQPEKQREIAEQLLAYGRIANLELKVKCKDGTALDGLFSGEIIDSQGKKYFLTVMIDQTRRKRAEETLRHASDRLALAARAGGVGIWDFDTVNNVLVWDDVMYGLYGVTADNFSGAYEAWQQGLHPDDLQRGDAEIQMALRGEKEFDTEFRVVWPNGTIRNIRALAIVQRDTSGQPTHMIGTNWDITELKQAEAALWESEALKIKEKALQENLAITENILRDTVAALSMMVELRDPATAGHHIRVAKLSAAIAKKMGLPDTQAGYIQTAALLHDIGRICISTELLNKTGPLNAIEYKLVQTHAQKGYALVKEIPFREPIAEIVYQHHERLDGSGYPRGLKDQEILTEAKIVAVAEVVDAMLTHRPYRQAPGIAKAVEELSAHGRYDETTVAACLELLNSGEFELKSAQ